MYVPDTSSAICTIAPVTTEAPPTQVQSHCDYTYNKMGTSINYAFESANTTEQCCDNCLKNSKCISMVYFNNACFIIFGYNPTLVLVDAPGSTFGVAVKV